MYGAIIGDYIGSIYEMNNILSKDFPLFSPACQCTDDSVMTAAVGSALLRSRQGGEDFPTELIREMRYFGKKFPQAGYGGAFTRWLKSSHPKPYNSWGNGSAMRVSPCALIASSMEEALELAKQSAEVTHNHPEGIKGAQALAAAVYLAKTGASKDTIRSHIHENYYPLEKTFEELRPDYKFDVSCQGSVPHAILAFLETEDLESCIRTAISIGGDSDTIASMASAIAWQYYGFHGLTADMTAIRDQLKLPELVRQTAEDFDAYRKNKS